MIDRSKFKPTSTLYMRKDIFNEEIDYFQKYIVEVSYKFETRAIELNNLYLETINEYDDRLYEEFKINIEEFPKILNSSMLITLQSILEKTLKKLLKDSLKKLNKSMREKEETESDIAYYKNIFKEEIAIDFSSSETVWKKINNFRLIRNLFVHNGGNINQVIEISDKRRIEKIINADKKTNNWLVLNEHTGDIIVYNNQYLISYLISIQEFCNNLFDQLIEKNISS